MRLMAITILVLVTGCSQGYFTNEDVDKLNKMCVGGGVKYFKIIQSSKQNSVGDIKTKLSAKCNNGSTATIYTKVNPK